MSKIRKITTAFAVTILSAMLFTTPALTTNGNIDGDHAHDDNAGSGAMLQDTSKVNSDDGSWEVSFYCKDAFRGGFLVGGPDTLQAAHGDLTVVKNTPWFFSNGIRLADGASTTISAEMHPLTPKYTDDAATENWGTNPEIMESFVLQNIVMASDYSRGNMSPSEAEEIVQMIRDAKTATPEETKAKVDSGEWFPFFVSMRPVEAKKPRRILLPSWS